MAEAIKLTTDGLLLNWLKDVGDSVNSGDVIAEIEADKATVEVEAPTDGVLIEISAEVGEELSEGAVIGQIGGEDEAPSDGSGGEQQAAAQAEEQKAEAQQQQQSQQTQQQTSSNGAVAATTPDGRIKISPVARNMAEERGIDISRVQGSGPGGRIVKADIENFDPGQAQPQQETGKQQPPAQAAPVGGQPSYGAIPQGDHVEVQEMDRMRQRIAETTVISKQQIPHFYITTDIDMAPLLALRKEINSELESEGIKVSVNDLLVKATALTLVKYPNLNSHFYGDRIVHHKRINVGIAVALPNNGLMYVVSKDADKAALSTMATEHKAMIARAREGRVKPDDIRGATFSTSNLGPFGIDHFSAIISPPEAGILAFGSAKQVPIVLEDGSLGTGNRMKVTISVDHRVSDGAEGAEYIAAFRDLLENPMRLLV